MEVYSVGNEYFDRSWLVRASSPGAAQEKVYDFIAHLYGNSKAVAASDTFFVNEVLGTCDIVESRDV